MTTGNVQVLIGQRSSGRFVCNRVQLFFWRGRGKTTTEEYCKPTAVPPHTIGRIKTGMQTFQICIGHSYVSCASKQLNGDWSLIQVPPSIEKKTNVDNHMLVCERIRESQLVRLREIGHLGWGGKEKTNQKRVLRKIRDNFRKITTKSPNTSSFQLSPS